MERRQLEAGKIEQIKNIVEDYPHSFVIEEPTDVSSAEEITPQHILSTLGKKLIFILNDGGIVGARRSGNKWALLAGGVTVISASTFLIYRNRKGFVRFIHTKIPKKT